MMLSTCQHSVMTPWANLGRGSACAAPAVSERLVNCVRRVDVQPFHSSAGAPSCRYAFEHEVSIRAARVDGRQTGVASHNVFCRRPSETVTDVRFAGLHSLPLKSEMRRQPGVRSQTCLTYDLESDDRLVGALVDLLVRHVARTIRADIRNADGPPPHFEG